MKELTVNLGNFLKKIATLMSAFVESSDTGKLDDTDDALMNLGVNLCESLINLDLPQESIREIIDSNEIDLLIDDLIKLKNLIKRKQNDT